MSKVCGLEDALSCIKDGDMVASTGVIGWLTPDALFKGIADRYRMGKGAGNLSFFFPVGVGDSMGIGGMDRVAIPGLMHRIVSGNYINPVNPATGKRPELMRLIKEGLIEAYSWPIGATMHWLREVARRGPGYFTKVGIGTYIDPRQCGGKLNDRTTADLVQLRFLEGEEYLFYPTWALNVGLIRASAADEFGNLSFDDEPIHSAALAIALAVNACGGRVIAQVKKIVPRSSIPAANMRVPGALIDYVVVDPSPLMTTDTEFDARYLGGTFNRDAFKPMVMGPDKVIARRAAQEVRTGEVSIFGFGASSDIPLVMIEDGLFDGDGIYKYPQTTEHGIFGGVVMSGWQFSANMYPEALIDGGSQFDFIDGGNCDFAALAFAQFDSGGHVNVSKFAGYNPGSGGFIDIAANTRRLVFTGTFTTGGLKVAFIDGGLRVVDEGRSRKFVNHVEQITYPVSRGVAHHGQSALLITERAVFQVDQEGLTLTEVAKGIDVQRDIIEQMDFRPTKIAEPLKPMSAELFRP